MPQESVVYAVARVNMARRGALDAARIDRLLAAPDYDEALRALAEIGWSVEGGDVESAAAAHVRGACALVRKITPNEAVTDCFLLRHDATNLKALIKARCLGQKAEHLSGCGVYPVEILEHAVADRTYKKLPQVLREALEGLEKALAVREDALLIDVTIDSAVMRLIHEKMEPTGQNAVARAYFAARADLTCAVIVLRIRRMGRDAAFLKSMLLPGGQIPAKSWVEAFEKPELLLKLLSPYGKKVKLAAAAAIQEDAKLPAIERAADDALMAMFSPFRRDALRPEPIFGYLLGAEREAAAVRLILAGKLNGFSPEAIRERLRDLYGG